VSWQLRTGGLSLLNFNLELSLGEIIREEIPPVFKSKREWHCKQKESCALKEEQVLKMYNKWFVTM
jgi:hypothetical protein